MPTKEEVQRVNEIAEVLGVPLEALLQLPRETVLGALKRVADRHVAALHTAIDAASDLAEPNARARLNALLRCVPMVQRERYAASGLGGDWDSLPEPTFDENGPDLPEGDVVEDDRAFTVYLSPGRDYYASKTEQVVLVDYVADSREQFRLVERGGDWSGQYVVRNSFGGIFIGLDEGSARMLKEYYLDAGDHLTAGDEIRTLGMQAKIAALDAKDRGTTD
jgi:hypothetical protein